MLYSKHHYLGDELDEGSLPTQTILWLNIDTLSLEWGSWTKTLHEARRQWAPNETHNFFPQQGDISNTCPLRAWVNRLKKKWDSILHCSKLDRPQQFVKFSTGIPKSSFKKKEWKQDDYFLCLTSRKDSKKEPVKINWKGGQIFQGGWNKDWTSCGAELLAWKERW